MFRVVLLLACLAACSAHAVLPLIYPVHTVPAVHASPYLHGHGAHGLGYGHGYASPLVHHLLKRSPHIVSHLSPVGHVSPLAVAPVAPVAVSHQSRVDVHSSPAVVPVPYVKTLVAPLHAPLVHKSYVAPAVSYGGHYGGIGPYGAGYTSHLGHY